MKKVWNSPDVTIIARGGDAITMSPVSDSNEIGTSYESIFGSSGIGGND